MPEEKQKPIAEVHKDLIAQAEANAQANSDAHAAQVAENQKFQALMEKNQTAAPPATETDSAKPAKTQK